MVTGSFVIEGNKQDKKMLVELWKAQKWTRAKKKDHLKIPLMGANGRFNKKKIVFKGLVTKKLKVV
jgi:hypothetical protein